MGELSCFEITTRVIELIFVVIGGFILGVLVYRRSVLEAIWQWTQLDGREDVMEARRFVLYELDSNYDPIVIQNNIDDAAKRIAPIANAYHHLGMLVRKKYIPIKTFKDNSTGRTIVIIYEKLLLYITKVREENNPNYANGFEYLYEKVKKFYP